MVKDELKLLQPVIYQSLDRAFKSKRLAHTFLLKGESNPLKLKTAILMAQSIIEDQACLACEACETCQRIANNAYYDVIFIDGNKQKIVKEDIDRIFEEFHKTSLEISSKKVFILAGIENASLKVWNMILKSIEEPSNNNYWIFISDNYDALLPTIISRCQTLAFRPASDEVIAKAYVEDGFDDVDAYLLARIHHLKCDIDLNDQAYLLAKEFCEKTIDALDDVYRLEVIFNSEWYSALKKSESDDFKKSQDNYLDMMIRLLLDALRPASLSDEWYQGLLMKLKKEDIQALLDIYYMIKDRSLSTTDRKLLFDRLAYEIVLYKTRR